jgi:hypothetical protein
MKADNVGMIQKHETLNFSKRNNSGKRFKALRQSFHGDKRVGMLVEHFADAPKASFPQLRHKRKPPQSAAAALKLHFFFFFFFFFFLETPRKWTRDCFFGTR